MVKHIRRILILALIMAVCFAMFAPSSFAMSPGQFKAWIAAALTAAQITVDSTIPVTAPIHDWIVNPFNITDGVYEAVDYSLPYVDIDYESPRETLDEYLSREGSMIVRGDTITIDGIDYTDIWVDNDAAQAFRTNVFDLETAWNIASNSNGKFVSGVGYFDGNVPAYQVGDIIRSQYVSGFGEGSGIGRYSGYINQNPGNHYGIVVDGNLHYSVSNNAFPWTVYIQKRGDMGYLYYPTSGSSSGYTSLYSNGSYYHAQPFDFSWVSQTIPAETLPSTDGMHLYVPNNPDQFSDPVVKQNITNFNNNLTFSPDVSINMGDPGIMDALDLLMDTINTLTNLTKPQYGPYDESPIPPVPPVDPDSIANTPWVQLQQRIDHIINQITSNGNIISNIQNQLGDIISSIGDISGKIVTGDRDWYKNITESLQKPFLPILTTFKNVTSIWHYVVSWVGVISAPFSWSLSALGSAGSIFLAPLYAAFAAAIVIAIYRRFGK